ncbi:MAG: cyclic nucleotide-binding domain-containing protein [Candidatus Abyssobacteria bacterium SURF_5]|uniref:Cyclic nucleotide-binding domain-containing protein n=1 Tax=Abyssobacteria bacterium (strain SURF_5) TaxID=2093360 RepID=A0A3A4NQK0_ABYX5|nr:MAG: cyclic nucleotide-binding domain-containing protein [Candidatus Abyssubacteria bacterium SURF_5]
MPGFDVFKGLSKSEINSIIDLGMIRPIDKGKLLFKKGDVAHEMFILIKGKIDIIDEYDTHKKVLAELGAGEIFGEMAMFGRHIRSAHALVREPSQVLVLSEDVLNKMLEKKIPKGFLTNIIGVLCHRLRLTNMMYMKAKYGESYPKEVEWMG